ncbi:MAG: IS1595 family transposase [Gammaproteobacteria bacterium]|nr:IS1595 family transposase [Gammaproteobacteria bacterium]
MAQKAPGKSKRHGITLLQLTRMFPDENAAREWFESIIWPNGKRVCGHCGSEDTYECSHAKMPFRCRDCGRYFGVKTGTVMAGSPLPLLKWLYAIYLDATSLKGVASMKLHRDLGITQKSAWFMQQRIREAFGHIGPAVLMRGPVEVDETYVGGKRRNMSNAKRKELTGRGPVGKTAVVGAKDRDSNRVAAKVVERTDGPTLQGFVVDNAEWDAEIYTDDATAYCALANHSTVKHSAGQYVDGQIHTNGVESFWSMLKRAHKGTFHKLSPKHLQRYVNEFAGRHNIRELDTLHQMAFMVRRLAGKRLQYAELIADNGLPSGAR